MNIPHQVYKIDINNINEPQTRIIECATDSGVRFVDVELWADSVQVTLPEGCTAIAIFVTDGILINDSVTCEISSDLTSVIVPIDNDVIQSKSGIMSVQVEITDAEQNVLALPYAFKVRVKKSILENAKITDESIGTVAEIMKEVAKARGDFANLAEALNYKLSDSDGTVKLGNLAQEILDYIASYGGNGEGGGVTLTQVQTLLADYAKASELDNKEDVSNRVTSITQAFTDESDAKYPTVLALLKYLSDYYYDYSDIYAAFDGIRIDDGNLIVLLPDGEEKSLGSVKGSDYILTDEDKTEIAELVEVEPVTRQKMSDELLKELGLEPNHNLTEKQIEIKRSAYNTFYDGTTTTGSCTSTVLFETPQYVRIVNNMDEDIIVSSVRFADSSDYDTATFTNQNLNHIHELGYLKNDVPAGEELIIPTYEYGITGREFMQLRWQPSTWDGAWNKIECYAIYDTWRPTYTLPDDTGMFIEDLPVKWVYQGFAKNANVQHLLGVVPYYPNTTYNIRGGYYPTTLINTLQVIPLFDDTIFAGYYTNLTHNSGTPNHVPLLSGYTTTQYDTSVNGGADSNYQWAYFTTPSETEINGVKWLAFDMGAISESASTDLGEEYYNAKLDELNDEGLKYRYISRWQDKNAPRRLFTTLVKPNESLQDDGSRYNALYSNSGSPLANAKWVLFGDSLTDRYGGHDISSNYFASKIAREFGMDLDNRAKSGSNIYSGGSGNYTSVSGIIKLDEYLAEIEAGTIEQADYITVAFGTNTFKAQMGTNDDTSETNTSVYGATKYFIEKIREKVPNAVFGFVLSPRQDWGSNDPNNARDLNGAREAIKTVCEEYGVPYIDMSKESGITVDMLPDGIHISSDQSQKLYYHAMRRFMIGL